MTRAIEFRAWYDGKMSYLDQMFVGIGQIGFSDEHYVDLNADDKEDAQIMQFTGLLDKNGKKVFEGDILDNYDSQQGLTDLGVSDSDRHYQGVVEWKNDKAGFSVNIGSSLYSEVIGNIYENGDLLDD